MNNKNPERGFCVEGNAGAIIDNSIIQ